MRRPCELAAAETAAARLALLVLCLAMFVVFAASSGLAGYLQKLTGVTAICGLLVAARWAVNRPPIPD
jgi:hypothetical protein